MMMFHRRYAVVLVLLLATGSARAQFGGFGGRANAEPKIAHFRLSGPLAEAPSQFGMFNFGGEPALSLKTLLERFRKARTDDSVKAIMLTLDAPTMGWAQVQELRDAINRFRAVDKDVYCHVESMDTKLYYLASSASHLAVVPTGDVFLTGLYSEMLYYKGLLDKLNCRMDMEHIGEYKGAAEPFTRTGPSDEAKEMQNWLLDSLYGQIVKGIAESRRLSEDRVREIIDDGPYTAEGAKAAGLIDAVEHRQRFVDGMRERYGGRIEIARNYGKGKGPEIDFSSPFGLFKFFSEVMQGATAQTKDAIAVIYAEGIIVTGRSQQALFGGTVLGSTTMRAVLEKAGRDPSIKAVVMRIDSPGGSAIASEIIHDAASRLARKKPLIVSMGNVAGSGGYYIAAGAHTIFAEPSTITGSIGVVGGKLVTNGVWSLFGLTSYEYTRGRNADLLNTNRPFTDDQRKHIRDWMTSIYTTFTKRVSDGRGERLKAPIEKIARGRVFTGEQAVENGLVDRLGGLDDAIQFAAREARIVDYDVRVLPKPKTLLDLLMQGFGMGQDDDETLVTPGRPFGADSALMQAVLPLLRQVDPTRAAAIGRMFLRIEMLRQPGVLAVMPTEYLFQ